MWYKAELITTHSPNWSLLLPILYERWLIESHLLLSTVKPITFAGPGPYVGHINALRSEDRTRKDIVLPSHRFRSRRCFPIPDKEGGPFPSVSPFNISCILRPLLFTPKPPLSSTIFSLFFAFLPFHPLVRPLIENLSPCTPRHTQVVFQRFE